MYRIMVVKSKKDNYESLYQYLTTTVDNQVSPREFSDTASLDTFVEGMLNDGYSKADFIIVQPVEYTIDAKDYTTSGQEEQ